MAEPATERRGRRAIMGKLVVTEFISLDGVMEDAGGAEKDRYDRGGWTFQFDRGEEGDKFKFDELMASDAGLLGRVTYEGFAKAWPAMDTDDFGRKLNSMPKFVVSSTLDNPTWKNTTVLRGDIMVAGSAQLAQSLLARDLVDRLHLMVFPVVLGEGKRLFADGTDMTRWKLVETKQTGEVVILVLERER